MKKIIATLLASAMLLGVATSCSDNTKKEIYYLNFKPEIADVYKEIATAYEAETGIKLNVVTAASGTYEEKLKSEIAKKDAPVLFQINGPKGYESWKEYCKDLSQTELYKHLPDKGLVVKSGDGVYGIPYTVEGYGIIVNNAIMEKYFATAGAKAASLSDINTFDKLKEVAEDMTAKKAELGIEGVFSSTSLTPGEDWRWQTHLANVPVYYEFNEKNIDLSSEPPKEIAFQYGTQYKNIFDLYINNSITAPGLLGSKTVDDSMAEFALGKVAMVQNGNWAWGQISGVSGNVVKAEDIKYLPIYTGVAGEEKQGLCIGTENFFAINSQAPAEKQKLAEDFIYWLYSSPTGKDFVVNKLGFIAPFDTFGENEKPSDPLATEVMNWMTKDGVTSVPWMFTLFPNQAYKDKFGAVLLEYSQGNKTWDDVTKVVVDEWKNESNG